MVRRDHHAVGDPLQRRNLTWFEQAVALADDHGLDFVTMRSLADALGVTPMSIYAHVADEDDILGAVIESRLRRVELPDHALPWQQRKFKAAGQRLAMLVEERMLLDRCFRPSVFVPAALVRMDAALRVLGNAGSLDGAGPLVARTICRDRPGDVP